MRHIYATVLLLLVVVFVIGILIGNSISVSKESEISRFIKNAELNTESYLIEQELLESSDEQYCQFATSRIRDLSGELQNIHNKLNAPGAQALRAGDFNLLKRKYHLMQIQTYFLLSKLRSNCDSDSDVILYYYQPNRPYDIGPMLTRISGQYEVTIFPIEYNYSRELNFLENYYSITETPAVIINYQDKLEGEVTYEQVTALLQTNSS